MIKIAVASHLFQGKVMFAVAMFLYAISGEVFPQRHFWEVRFISITLLIVAGTEMCKRLRSDPQSISTNWIWDLFWYAVIASSIFVIFRG